jgi:prepilin-type N-terminal cleavage/methylation domain-containing protein
MDKIQKNVGSNSHLACGTRDTRGTSAYGFTLIELILVITILLSLGAMSGVFYSRLLTQSNVQTVSDQLIGSFRKAQTYAMASKRGSAWGVHYASNTITLYKGSTFGVDTSFNETFTVPQSITITGFTDINFARVTGLSASGTPSTTPTIIISGTSNTSEQITVNAQGVASR